MANNYPYHPDGQRHRRVTENSSVQDAQSLLSVYPTASATPSTHVVRHINNMTVAAPPPTFIQPGYYSYQQNSYPQGNPPPYSEYAQEIAYMSGPPTSNDGGYWQNTRNQALGYVQQQVNHDSSYRFPASSNWTRSEHPSSSYHTSQLSQSMFNHTRPASAYPTPPPPPSSSSSLAGALGPVELPPERLPQRTLPPAEQPAQFFNNFLDQKTRQLSTAQSKPAPMTPRRPKAPSVSESPDPLALKATNLTPKKRKPVVEITSPFPKRIHREGVPSTPQRPRATASTSVTPSSSFSYSPSSVPRTPTTVSTARSTSVSTTQSTGKKRSWTMDFIQVPPAPYLTPTSTRKHASSSSVLSSKRTRLDESPDELAGYGTENDDPYFSSPSKGADLSPTKMSGRRAGDRDDRAPLEKLVKLLQDIFEAEDALPSEVDISDIPTSFFSTQSPDLSQPHLNENTVRKLTKYIGLVARPTKRSRAATGNLNTPRSKARMTEVDTSLLSRALKILTRSVKAGEDVDPFMQTGQQPNIKSSPKKPSAKKGKKKAEDGRSKSESPAGDENKDDTAGSSRPVITDLDIEKLTQKLSVSRDSVLAAECCLALLGSDRLTKQLYSEEMITSCLNSIKNQLTKIVYPFVEASSESSSSDSLLHRLTAKNTSHQTEAPRRLLGEIFQGLCAVLPRISILINSDGVAMSDTIIIQVVYIAIGPFFVVDSGADGDHKGKGKEKDSSVIRTFGKSGMRGLRLDALALIRSIFANHEDQRSWIIEEILSSLIKLSDTKQKAGQFRLRDGRSIRTVSALLLQLVQTSAHDVRVSAKRIEKARQQKIAMKRQESFNESQQAPEPFLDEHDKEEIRLYSTGLESATKAAQTIVLFLTQRSGKTKVTKNSNEAEYRTIFDNLISDLLVVLFWPEWPAASLLLGIACKYMVASLDDVKTSQKEGDNNAAKTIALDHLGIIAARIRSTSLKVQQEHEESRGKKLLKPMEEIVNKTDINSLDRLLAAHRDVATHLSKRASDDQAYDSAQELTAATLGQELASALKKADRWVADGDDGDDEMNIRDSRKDFAFGNRLKEAMRGVWKDQSDIFDMGSSEEANRIDRIAEEIGSIQGLLRNCFQPVLNVILTALDAPAVFMRTKALRALGQIVTSDASVLALPNVRQAIETHLLDHSSAVRDAAVELIGKYMIDSPEVASDYYPKIAERMADTGLGVRKRVIKLLKSFYPVADNVPRQTDIATKMVLRMLDEDDTVKELAMKTIEDLWFPTTTMPPSALKSSKNAASAEQNGDAALLNKVAVIVGVSAAFKDRHSPLEDLLHKIMAEKEGAEASALHAKYSEICDTLIDGLVDCSDQPGFTVINCIRTIHLIASAYPSIITSSSASTLLPYLKNLNSPEEHATSDYILKIFRASIPHMPKTAVMFGQELQQVLQPMIIKPTSGGLATLQESVACICVVVQHLTHDYGRLVALLRSCNARLQELTRKPDGFTINPNDVRALSTLIFIVSLLGEHCPFDQFRNDSSVSADVVKNLDSISQGPIVEHIYNTLLKLHARYEPLRPRVLHCLGFLFRAQPTLMVMDSSAQIMDTVFASSNEEERGRMLKIMQDFLNAEAAKHAAKEKETNTKRTSTKAAEVNMEELVGNTEGFADSGVSSAVVQRYLTYILDAAFSQNPHIQASAIDIISFTVKQGLAHPLQSFPIIVALETSPFPSLSNRASSLHSILHGKHASLLNTRFVVSARTSFEYQCKISPNNVKGYRLQPMPVAVLHRWYLLVREKRPNRQEFLKSLVKVFNHDNPDYHSTQTDVEFVRYMAENFSAFDYKTLEEVLTVIKFLTKILSTTGQHILEVLSPNHLLTSIRAPVSSNAAPASSTATPINDASTSAGEVEVSAQDRQEEDEVLKEVVPPSEDRLPVLRTSVSIAIVMLLKAHLKALYSLSEDKCSKFVLGKKSTLGDRPATKKHDKPISWERLPFATKPMLTTADGEEQRKRFLDIWNEDGVSAEPEDEFDAVVA